MSERSELVDVGTPRLGVALVTMNDPRRYNAVSASMISDLRKAIADLRQTREVRAIVLTGAGKGFCAGADLGFEDDPFPTPKDVASSAPGTSPRSTWPG